MLRPNYQRWRIEGVLPHVRIHLGDLLDDAFITNAVRIAKPDWIFHLSAYGAYSWQKRLPDMVATNILALEKLLQTCVQCGFESFVNTGSSSEYGHKDHAPAEDERLEPNSYYAITKAAATHICRLTASEKKVWIPTLRLYSVYGPYEDPRRFIPTLVSNGLEGRLPPLVDGKVARDYVFIDDVCSAYLLAAQHRSDDWGEVYNIGSGVQTTIRDAVECIKSLVPIQAEATWGSMPNREWDTFCWKSDPTKAHRQLGWIATTNFQSGLHKMVQWASGSQI